MDELRKIPPVTRFIVLSTVGISVPALVLDMVNPLSLLFNYRLVVEKFQVGLETIIRYAVDLPS
jgi:Derlin-2/3